MRTLLITLLGLIPMACRPSGEENFEIQAFTEKQYPGCSQVKVCNDLAFVDCGSAADGPSFYLERWKGKRISTCGGACWGPRDPDQVKACETLCPPKEWTCLP